LFSRSAGFRAAVVHVVGSADADAGGRRLTAAHGQRGADQPWLRAIADRRGTTTQEQDSLGVKRWHAGRAATISGVVLRRSVHAWPGCFVPASASASACRRRPVRSSAVDPSRTGFPEPGRNLGHQLRRNPGGVGSYRGSVSIVERSTDLTR
jgi:hypothetical protein